MSRPPRPVNMSLNLAPLVDVMMCLIIFFLLASKLVDVQMAAVDLPPAEAAQQIPEGEMQNRVVITVRPAADQPTAEYLVRRWDGERIRESSLTPEEVAAFLLRHAQRTRAAQQTPRCVVRADRAVRYADVEVVLRACGVAEIPQIVFYAEPIGESR